MQDDKDLVLSAIGLRKLIGCLGIALPVLCFVCSLLAVARIGDSISAYYFTGIHGLFTGILCGLGVCLYSYRGFSDIECNLATFGGICAFGVATCPTTAPQGWQAAPDAWVPSVVNLFAGPNSGILAIFHGIFAGLLFVVFMVFAAVFFTRSHASDENDPLTIKGILRALLETVLLLKPNSRDRQELGEKKERRNKIYRLCGRLIGLSIAMVIAKALGEFLLHRELPFRQWTFLWETVAIWSFAFSWLTKAESFSFVRDDVGAGLALGASSTIGRAVADLERTSPKEPVQPQ